MDGIQQQNKGIQRKVLVISGKSQLVDKSVFLEQNFTQPEFMIRRNLANFVTLLNLACGFMAIAQIYGRTEKGFYLAFWLILLASVFDFLDGLVARALGTSGPMGAELDALADAVTFGVAPGLMALQLINYDLFHHAQQSGLLHYAMYTSLVIPLAAAWRLARFNAMPHSSGETFSGLPAPAAGIMVAALSHVVLTNQLPWLVPFVRDVRFLMIYLIFVAFLMVSTVPFGSMKPPSWNPKHHPLPYILGAIAMILVLWGGVSALPLFVFPYLLASLLFNRSGSPKP